MNSKKEVTKRFWSLVAPELASVGFGRFSGNHVYRDRAATIDVIKLEFFTPTAHREWGTTPYSFGLSAGIYPGFAPNPFGGRIAVDAAGKAEPDENICAVRTRAIRRLRQPKHVPSSVWQIEAETANAALALTDAQNALRTQFLPWFGKFSDPQALLDLFRSGEENFESVAPCFGFGRVGSPVRNLYLGFTALNCGDEDLAKCALTAALSKGDFLALSGSSVVDDEIHDALARIDRE